MKRWKQTGFMLLLSLLVGLSGACKDTKADGKQMAEKKEAAKEQSVKEETKEAENDGAFHGTYVVDAEYVKERVGKEDVLFVDARGWKKAVLGTVKGAIATTWQDLSTCQEGKAGDENWGKIPKADDFAKRLGNLGMTKDKEIILIADSDGWGDDARIVWQLAAAGYENIKMLDGGIDAAKAAGVDTQLLASEPGKGSVSIDKIDDAHVMTTEELQKHYDDYKIVDVRTDEEYNGAVLYEEAKGGHLPGAVHLPLTEFFQEDGRLKSNKEIIALCETAGLKKEDQVVAYCTGGIRSAYTQLVLEMCGYENTWNYDQSFWRWAVVGEVE